MRNQLPSSRAATLTAAAYYAPERTAWVTGALAVLSVLALGLVLTFLVGSLLQWRSEARAQSVAAASARIVWDLHDPALARNIQVGSLR